MKILSHALLLLFLLTFTVAAESERKIVKVRDGIYRATSGNYHSLVWDTSQGLIVVDPISKETAAWLNVELETRFNKPIRYLIYSHNHPDHSLGGELLGDSNTITVSHQYAAEDMEWTKLDTRLPELTFEKSLELQIDGETLKLRHHGPNNGRGSISFHFQKSRVLFVVDWVVLGRMPYKNLPGYDIHGMIRSTQDVLDLDWDLFVGGHADIGDRKGVERYLSYLRTLYARVRDGMLAGQTLDELKKTLLLSEFRDLRMFEEWRPLNIEGVYRTLESESYLLTR